MTFHAVRTVADDAAPVVFACLHRTHNPATHNPATHDPATHNPVPEARPNRSTSDSAHDCLRPRGRARPAHYTMRIRPTPSDRLSCSNAALASVNGKRVEITGRTRPDSTRAMTFRRSARVDDRVPMTSIQR